MKLVVTGGAGFIGSNLVRAALDLTLDVVVVDDLSTGSWTNLDGLNIEFLRGSVLDPSVMNQAMSGANCVIHLAALGSVPRSIENPTATHEANASGTLQVLEASRRHNVHTITASSSSVYGANPALPKVESLKPQPMSPYAVSKLAAEGYTIAYQRVYDLPTLSFRFFNVYGPRQSGDHAYAAVIPLFIRRALANVPLVVHGDGRQTRDFTYVGTVVDALLQAATQRTVSVEPVNLAFGSRNSLLEIIEFISNLLGRPLDVEHVAARPGDVRDSQADNALLRSLLPDLTPVPIRSGIERTVTWNQRRASGLAAVPKEVTI